MRFPQEPNPSSCDFIGTVQDAIIQDDLRASMHGFDMLARADELRRKVVEAEEKLQLADLPGMPPQYYCIYAVQAVMNSYRSRKAQWLKTEGERIFDPKLPQ